jgi:hypothetical protein
MAFASITMATNKDILISNALLKVGYSESEITRNKCKALSKKARCIVKKMIKMKA